jgi:hypothetical protein
MLVTQSQVRQGPTVSGVLICVKIGGRALRLPRPFFTHAAEDSVNLAQSTRRQMPEPPEGRAPARSLISRVRGRRQKDGDARERVPPGVIPQLRDQDDGVGGASGAAGFSHQAQSV